jgi:hypothetical protein
MGEGTRWRGVRWGGYVGIYARISCTSKKIRAYCMRSRFPLLPTGEMFHAVAPDRSRYAL